MNQIIVGAASAILGDKTGQKMDELTGQQKPHLEEHGECLHADIHDIKHWLRAIADSLNPVSETGTPRAVTAQITPIKLLEANQHRKGVSVFNASTSIMYIGLFVSTSLMASLYTTPIPPNTLYEMPTIPLYKGEISAMWASANGLALVTEMT